MANRSIIARSVIAWTCPLLVFFIAVSPFVHGSDAGGDMGERIREPVSESVEIRKQTQQEDEAWQAEREALIARYDRLREENARLGREQAVLEERVTATGKRVRDKERALAGIEQLTMGIDPFLREMVARIEGLVDGEMPFLQSERTRRLDRLKEMMDDPDIPISDKFRRVMEALLVEAEYGNTIEVYQETIGVSGRTMLVNIFRLGRVSLFYQSMDQQSTGYFDVADNAWKELPSTYNRAIISAVDIGAKRQPVELLVLPLGRMVVK